MIENFTKSTFENALSNLKKGQFGGLPYDIFSALFPPGVEDDDAKLAALAWAKAHNCEIQNNEQQQEVRFVKVS